MQRQTGHTSSLLGEHLAVAPHSQALRCGAIVPGPVPWGRPAVKLTGSYHFPCWIWLVWHDCQKALQSCGASWWAITEYERVKPCENYGQKVLAGPWMPMMCHANSAGPHNQRNEVYKRLNDWWLFFILCICDWKLAWTSWSDVSRHHKSKVRSADVVLIGKWQKHSTWWWVIDIHRISVDLIDYGNNAVYGCVWNFRLTTHQFGHYFGSIAPIFTNLSTLSTWNESLWAQRCHIPLGVWESSTCPTSSAPTVLWAAGKPASCSEDLPGNGFAHRLVPIALELLQQGSLWIGFDHLGFGLVLVSRRILQSTPAGQNPLQHVPCLPKPRRCHTWQNMPELYLGFPCTCSLCPSDCFCTVGNASRAQATALLRFFGNEL